jgi:hypothetical protein
MKVAALPSWFCRHRWGFPRRWPEFQGRIDVDVQTCTRCGARRRSPVQFGREREQVAGAGELREVADEAPARP